MNKSASGTVLVLATIFLMWIFSLFLSADQNYCSWHQAYLNEEIQGKVTSTSAPWRLKRFFSDTIILLDAHTRLYLHDGKQMRNLYAVVDTNDTVWKRKGSDTLFVYRNEHLLQFFKVTNDCQ